MKMNRKIAGVVVVACLLLLGGMLAVTLQAEEGIVAGLGRDAGGVYGSAHHHPPLTRIFETLVASGYEVELVPQLATSWEVSNDGLTWTFHLREGVKFHDGTPFNAEAAAFSLQMHNKRRPGHLGHNVSITAIDEYTLQINHTEPFAPLLHQLSWPFFSMASRAAFDEGNGSIVNPIGTGPFKEKEWVPGEKLVLVRNEDYWGGVPKTEKVTLKHIPDDATRVMALEAGEIDMIIDVVGAVPPEFVPALKNNPEIEVMTIPRATVSYMTFNCRKPPFDDVRVRQAIQYAIDRESIINHTLDGFGEPVGDSILSPMVTYSHPNLPVRHDVERAKQLLGEAGWIDTNGDGILDKDGKDFKVLWFGRPDMPPHCVVAEVIQAQLREVGIIVEIRALESGALRTALEAGEHNIGITSFPYLGPHNVLYRTFHSEGDFNLRGIFYNNSEVDRLLERGKATMDIEERHQRYFEAQKIIAEESPVVPLYDGIMINAVRNNIRGYRLHPWFVVNWEDIYEAES